MNHRIAALALCASVIVGQVFSQTTRLVPDQYPTIQSAINACVNGDTVLVAPGTHSGPIDFLGKAITVQGSGGADVTTLLGLACETRCPAFAAIQSHDRWRNEPAAGRSCFRSALDVPALTRPGRRR